MKKEVIIDILSTQTYEDMEPDEISLVTDGFFYEKNGKFYIKYDESELCGIKDTKTTLKIDGETITLIRSGSQETQMIFKNGEHNIGLYNTPAGPYTLGVKTKKLDYNLTEIGGKISLEYEVELNYQMSGYNTFVMKIKTIKEN